MLLARMETPLPPSAHFQNGRQQNRLDSIEHVLKRKTADQEHDLLTRYTLACENARASGVLARLASLAQTEELARGLVTRQKISEIPDGCKSW